MALSITVQGGTIVNVTEDFVFTKTRTVNGTALAGEIQDAQEVPSVILSTPTLAWSTHTLCVRLRSPVRGDLLRTGNSGRDKPLSV